MGEAVDNKYFYVEYVTLTCPELNDNKTYILLLTEQQKRTFWDNNIDIEECEILYCCRGKLPRKRLGEVLGNFSYKYLRYPLIYCLNELLPPEPTCIFTEADFITGVCAIDKIGRQCFHTIPEKLL